ncbi:MAG: hypothetical protein Kow009_11130 [Spirochaetales bacterium]
MSSIRNKSRQLPSLLFLSLLLCSILLACSRDREEKEVAETYERLVSALEAGNEESVYAVAPHLKQDPSGTAMERLKELVLSSPEFTIHMIDNRTAEVVLDTNPEKSIPFQRDASGKWIVPEKIVRTQVIDFLPADPSRRE